MLDLGISVRTRVLVFPLAASSHEAASSDGRDGTAESHDSTQPLRRPGRSCKAEGSDAFLALRLQQRELEHQKRAVKKGVKKPIANNPKTRVVTNHTSTSQSTQVSSVFPLPRYPAAWTVSLSGWPTGFPSCCAISPRREACANRCAEERREKCAEGFPER